MKQNILTFIIFFILIFFIGYNKIKSDERHLIKIKAQDFKSQIFEMQFYFVFDENVKNKDIEYFLIAKEKIKNNKTHNKYFINNISEAIGDEIINYSSQKVILIDNHIFYQVEMSDLICSEIIDTPPRINETCKDNKYKVLIH